MGEPVREVPSPGECRRLATDAAAANHVSRSVIWALLAIAGELAEIRRELRRSR
ncbi:hypothetical protein ABZ793_32955 [Micromonospora sp. NPDC047465]|uniref:hypothetical protein n=1 Tax=Micromonospora sp. NPDC047465 TaxID=3154813 RepID=UPI0033F23614